MNIHFEHDVLRYLNLPSIPLKKWDGGRRSFKDGVAVVELMSGEEAYAVATYDADADDAPRIKKTFSLEPFSGIKEIFIVPEYMDTQSIQESDMDEQSKAAAERLAQEVDELENEGVEELHVELPENEYFFDFIHNDEEAVAFLKSKHKQMKIKGKLPKGHDAITARLGVIWRDEQKKNNKK